ncbi:hypothetical protein H4S02_007366, partial [Coemansia sp. RSA 2611]
PYNAPPPQSSSSDPHGMQQQMAMSTESMSGGRIPSFLFTQDTAQESANMLNVFMSQLSQEQVRQFSEGMQSYSIQNSVPHAQPSQPPMPRLFTARNTSAGPSEHSITSSGNGFATISGEALMANAAVHQMHSFAPGFDASSIPTSVNTGRLQMRRGSLPISSNGDLFIAPGSRPVFPTSTAPPAYVSQQIMGVDGLLGSELDPMLFNPMTPFLQELQLLNSMPVQQQSSLQGSMLAGSSSGATRESNGQMHK